MINILMIAGGAVLLAGCAVTVGQPTEADPVRQVRETERAFARSMAERDFEAFTSFLSEECVFFSGPSPLHGRKAVADWWKRYFEGPDAPFSWEPEQVEVLESGALALSTGPVYDPSGKLIATFTSIWRQEGPGIWRILFDKGNDVCEEQNKEQ
ncbi:MAG: nuclear transport factor 2 family protein [Bacteroidota bacterium]